MAREAHYIGRWTFSGFSFPSDSLKLLIGKDLGEGLEIKHLRTKDQEAFSLFHKGKLLGRWICEDDASSWIVPDGSSIELRPPDVALTLASYGFLLPPGVSRCIVPGESWKDEVAVDFGYGNVMPFVYDKSSETLRHSMNGVLRHEFRIGKMADGWPEEVSLKAWGARGEQTASITYQLKSIKDAPDAVLRRSSFVKPGATQVLDKDGVQVHGNFQPGKLGPWAEWDQQVALGAKSLAVEKSPWTSPSLVIGSLIFLAVLGGLIARYRKSRRA